jgi:wobble nucleotide-excising tRNase
MKGGKRKMKNNESAKEELKKRLEEDFQESMREHEFDKVTEGIMDLFDNSSLSAIEILGLLEMIKQFIHRDCICDECKQKGVDI